VEPRNGPFNEPPRLSQAATVFRVSASDDRPDPQPSQHPARRITIISSISLDGFGAELRATRLTGNERQVSDQREQFDNVGHVRRCQMGSQGDSLGVDEKMVF
jgi:hypothetical protein